MNIDSPQMALEDVMRAFFNRYRLNFSKGHASMLAVFYVEVWWGGEDRRSADPFAQHQVVHCLITRGEVDHKGAKVLMPIVLWTSASVSRSYTAIKEWEVIHDREIAWEFSLSRRMSAFIEEGKKSYRYCAGEGTLASPESSVSYRISFFTHGDPQIVAPKEVHMAADRKTCSVTF